MREHLKYALLHPREALRLYENAYHRWVFEDLVNAIHEHELRSRVASVKSDAEILSVRVDAHV